MAESQYTPSANESRSSIDNPEEWIQQHSFLALFQDSFLRTGSSFRLRESSKNGRRELAGINVFGIGHHHHTASLHWVYHQSGFRFLLRPIVGQTQLWPGAIDEESQTKWRWLSVARCLNSAD